MHEEREQVLHRGDTRDAALRRQLIGALLQLARHRRGLGVGWRTEVATEPGELDQFIHAGHEEERPR